MNRRTLVAPTLLLLTLLSVQVFAQTDDVRQATGLPIPIGAPVIYGQVAIRGLAASEPKPVIYVSLFLNGIQTDRTQTNDRGYYFFLKSPANGAALVFEIDNSEVGRVILSSGAGNTVRQNIEVDWQAVKANRSVPGVVSIKDAYPRSPEADKILEDAMAAARAKRAREALALFKQVVDQDPKDFVAWTEIGSLYFDNSKYVDAEFAYGKALEQKSDFMPALMNLGKLYLSQKNNDMAIAAFLRAANTDPKAADAFQYLGESYLQAKQGSKAVIALNEAIWLEPAAMAEMHLRLAALYDAAGAKDRAAAEYKKFLAKRPNYAERQKLEAYIKANPPK